MTVAVIAALVWQDRARAASRLDQGGLNAVVRAKSDGEWRVAYAQHEAAIMVGSVSSLGASDTVFVKSIGWEPVSASR